MFRTVFRLSRLINLFGDLWEILADTIWQALVGLFASPLVSLAILTDLPNRLLGRLQDVPREIVADIIVDIASKMDFQKELKNRVIRADRAVAMTIILLGESVAAGADPGPRGTQRQAEWLSRQKGIRRALEEKLGMWSLSTKERTLGRILKLISSPARIVLLVLKIWDVFVSASIALTGVLILGITAIWVTSPNGIAQIKAFCLRQTNRIRSFPLIDEQWNKDDEDKYGYATYAFDRPVSSANFRAVRYHRKYVRVRDAPTTE